MNTPTPDFSELSIADLAYVQGEMRRRVDNLRYVRNHASLGMHSAMVPFDVSLEELKKLEEQEEAASFRLSLVSLELQQRIDKIFNPTP